MVLGYQANKLSLGLLSLLVLAASLTMAANPRFSESMVDLSGAGPSLPMWFEPIEGESNAFVARSLSVTARVEPGSVTWGGEVAMQFVGAKGSKVFPERRLRMRSTYLDADGSRSVATYGALRYEDAYPGIDILFRSAGGHLEYDFEVSPGAHAEGRTVRFAGAKSLRGDGDGGLLVRTPSGELHQKPPVSFQIVDGRRVMVGSRFEVVGRRTAELRIATYDRRLPITVDPVVEYSSYLGGSGLERALGVETDDQGFSYVVGRTGSGSFPTVDPAQAAYEGQSDAFVAKVHPNGGELIYATFLGGTGFDEATSVDVTPAGGAVVGGITCSTDFPTTKDGARPKGGRNCDGFIARMTNSGDALKYSTYLGGTGFESIADVALDHRGAVYVTGDTRSDGIVRSQIQSRFGGGTYDAFVAKLNKRGTEFLYFTFLGGKAVDRGRSIAVDGRRRVYVTGFTESRDFPTKNAWQSKKKGPKSSDDFAAFDAFLTSINRKGTKLRFSTFFGGSNGEAGFGIGVAPGRVVIAGRSQSDDLKTKNAFQPAFGGDAEGDGMVAAFSKKGTKLRFASYMGGSGFDRVFGVAVDDEGTFLLTGRTNSQDLPLVDPVQATYAGGFADGFVSRISADGMSLLYSTYLGGNDYDRLFAIASVPGEPGSAIVVGQTSSTDISSGQVFQPANAGGYSDASITKLGCSC